MRLVDTIRRWSRAVLRDAMMLWFAQRHPDTPLAARAVCFFAAAYALSPIDLIPDFIPVLGFVDDALLLPAVVWLAVRLLPPHVVTACRAEAENWVAAREARPRSWVGAAVILVLWTAGAIAVWRWLAPHW